MMAYFLNLSNSVFPPRGSLNFRLIFPALVAIMALGTGGWAQECSIRSPGEAAGGTKSIVQGYYSFGFEHSGFTPCGEDPNYWWWVSFHDDQTYAILRKELDQLGGSKYESPRTRLYVRAVACVSKPGTYGHLGAYSRQIEILELIESHPESAGDCSPADSDSQNTRNGTADK